MNLIATDILSTKSYFILIFVAPFCFFFPYHIAFVSLSLFGFWHIYSEINVWKSIGIKNSPTSIEYIKIPISAFFLSIFSIMHLLLSWSGFNIGIWYSYFFLIAIGIWFFLVLIFLKNFEKSSYSHAIWISCGILYSILIWVRPNTIYFLIVHLHNILPWLILYKMSKDKRVWFLALLLSFILPICVFFTLSKFGAVVSDLALSNELEQEIFRQILSSEVDMISGTTFLGYFAYQQFLHYFLWIYLLPKYIKEINLLNKASKPFQMNFLKWESFAIVGIVCIAFILFMIFPVEFRKIYFAVGFFHVAMEYPLLIQYFNERKTNRESYNLLNNESN